MLFFLFTGDLDYSYPSLVPLDSETHGGEDVAVFASGPWQHLFTSSYEQSVIPHMMAYAMCLDDNPHENCRPKIQRAFWTSNGLSNKPNKYYIVILSAVILLISGIYF